jgi:serine/threonine-protein kinase
MDDLSIEQLIARSSLGTPAAARVRRQAPGHVVDRVLERATQIDARGIPTVPPHRVVTSVPTETSADHPKGPRMVVATSLLPGQFTIRPIRDLGQGGLGRVDEVEVIDTNLSHPIGTRLARKRLGAQWADDPGAKARFEREIEMLQTMQHPNVVPFEGASLPGGERWYVMALFQRGSVRAWLQSGGRFASVSQAATFVAKIADALTYAHSLNFIHRDLKPENILLSDAGEPVIADWGLRQFVHLHSKVLDLTRGGPMGTHYYCSLEQWTSGRCAETGDVYSLGVILAELMGGRAHPISPVGVGIQRDVVQGTDWVSQTFNAIVRKMTAFNAASRYQTMGEVAQALWLLT